jgi:hypothetical protein
MFLRHHNEGLFHYGAYIWIRLNENISDTNFNNFYQ